MRNLLLAAMSAVLISGCAAPSSDIVGGDQPLEIALKYGRDHYPPNTFDPHGAGLEHQVVDRGEFWDVDYWPADSATGGGLHVRIRKSDNKVISAGRTQ